MKCVELESVPSDWVFIFHVLCCGRCESLKSHKVNDISFIVENNLEATERKIIEKDRKTK